jgi:hypothetical protein
MAIWALSKDEAIAEAKEDGLISWIEEEKLAISK